MASICVHRAVSEGPLAVLNGVHKAPHRMARTVAISLRCSCTHRIDTAGCRQLQGRPHHFRDDDVGDAPGRRLRHLQGAVHPLTEHERAAL